MRGAASPVAKKWRTIRPKADRGTRCGWENARGVSYAAPVRFWPLFLLIACAEDVAPGLLVDVVVTHPPAPPIAPATECTVTTGRDPAGGANHVDPCEQIDFDRVPPVGGEHYSRWANFESYTSPVPWGFLVHSMEHGAVVLAYDCPDGCPEVVARFERFAAELDDPVCRGMLRPNRIIVVPAPDLEEPIAALAWEHLYTATCLDEASIQAFIDAHYAMAPEDFCFAGLGPDQVMCP